MSWPEQAPPRQLTRGTTGHNRLRRSDRWLVHSPRVRTALQSAADPLVDRSRLRRAAGDHAGAGDAAAGGPRRRARRRPGDPPRTCPHRPAPPPATAVEFALGGFELAGHRPVLVRAFNVLRQYPGRGGARRVVGDAAAAGARRADRRRHLRRTGQAVLLGAAGRRRAGEPDAGVRPVRHRPPIGSGRATTQGADPPQRRRASRSTRCWRPPTARGPASPATACSVRGCGGARCWNCCATTVFRWSRRAAGCATACSPCRGRRSRPSAEPRSKVAGSGRGLDLAGCHVAERVVDVLGHLDVQPADRRGRRHQRDGHVGEQRRAERDERRPAVE